MPRPRLRRRTFRSILCPIDFSASSRASLRYGAALARRSHGSLVVLFVNDPLLVAAAAAAYSARTLAAGSDRELRGFVTKALGPVPNVPSITFESVVGSPALAILKVAREHHCDLIVMGTHGRSGPSRWLLGSVTRAVLKRTVLPVMAIPPAHRGTKAPAAGARGWPGPHFIAPIDLNDHARADATRAAAVARGFGAKLVLFHVLPGDPPPPAGADVPASFWRKKAKAQQGLDAIRRTIADVVEDCRVTAGTPARAVATLAGGGQYGMVVLTLRRSGWFGSPPGSITYQILGRSRTPVLALPPRSAPSRLTGLSRKSLAVSLDRALARRDRFEMGTVERVVSALRPGASTVQTL